MDIEVLRGSFSSVEISRVNFPVFHTSNFTEYCTVVPKEYTLPHGIEKTIVKTVAIAGDILVARVGRNLSKKVCLVRLGMVVVSDCILILRVTPPYRKKVFTYLKSEAGRLALDAATHGVGSKFITIQSLLDLTF